MCTLFPYTTLSRSCVFLAHCVLGAGILAFLGPVAASATATATALAALVVPLTFGFRSALGEPFFLFLGEVFLDLLVLILVDRGGDRGCDFKVARSEEHTSELQSLMRISYAVFCL